MSKRIPVLPTILVALAVAAMIGLGVWQLRRAEWKQGLLDRYAAAQDLPAIAYPRPNDSRNMLFRRATGFCAKPIQQQPTAGRNAAGEAGWSHIVTCRSGRGNELMAVDIGWSTDFLRPPAWRGGPVEGVIVPDSVRGIRLVASRAPVAGMEPSQPPGPDSIPNNHLMYAAQWFFFAAVAALIYWLAVRRRTAPA